MKMHQRKFNVFPLTHIERNFVYLCNKKAQKLGIELEWKLYDTTKRDINKHRIDEFNKRRLTTG